MSSPPATPPGAPHIIVCDYNALLLSVTGLLRMSGYCVFQAYDGEATRQLCEYMPDIELVILNTEGTGGDTPQLVRDLRVRQPGLPVLHIGRAPLVGMPSDVRNLSENFGADDLLGAVRELLSRRTRD
jgi:response regulator RpfG family c-di-GMP phosphodiesterase